MSTSPRQQVILVGWDFGDRARDALALAALLARELGFGIRLGHVHEIYPAYPPYTDLTSVAQDVGRRLLDEAPVEQLEGIEVDRELVAAHSPSAGLHSLSESPDVAMVVVGSAHRGPLGRALPGTVAHHLLHGSPCAVAVAPADYARHARPEIATVAVAYDASAESRAAVEEATQIARTTGAKLRIISVIEPTTFGWIGPAMVPPADLAEIEARARRSELDEVMSSRPPDIACEDVLCEGGAGAAIGEHSADADLLVMGSRGYGPVRRVLLGSVSSRVVRSARCPVLVIPRAAIDEPEGRTEQAAAAT